MVKLLHIFYKEWLKTRWYALFILVVGAAVCTYLYMDVASSFKTTGAFDYTLRIMYSNPQANFYRSIMMYLPLVASLFVGLSQFLPEVIDKKIKLTLHLPLKHNTVLFMMQSFGVCLLTVIYLAVLTGFFITGLTFFPAEINVAFAVSLAPWFIGGYATYFMITMISMEPNILRQIIYSALTYFFVRLFYTGVLHGDTERLIIPLVLLTVVSGITLFYSINRFIKGEL